MLMLKYIIFIIVNLIAFFSIDILFFKYFLNKKDRVSRLLFIFTIYILQIYATITILGYASLLYLPAIIILHIFISTSIFLYTSPTKDLLKSYIIQLNNFVVSPLFSVKKTPLFVGILFVIAFLLFLYFITLGILFPSIDWDGLSYHLTFSANAIQFHTILDQPTSIPWLNGYPKFGEIMQFWNIIFFRNDRFVDLTNILFLILSLFSIYHIARYLGISKKSSVIAAISFLFIPVIMAGVKTTYVDIIFSSLFLLSLYYLLTVDTTWDKLMLFGISLSLLVETKLSGVLFALFFFVLFFAKIFFLNGRKQYKKILVSICILTALLLSIGGHWYIKNYFLYKNPIYPWGYSIGTYRLFPGKQYSEVMEVVVESNKEFPKNNFQRIFYNWTERRDHFGCFYNYDAPFTGFGPFWFTFLLPAILISLLLGIRKRDFKFLSVSFIFIAGFLIHPSNWYARYSIFFIGYGALSFGFLYDFLKRDTRLIVNGIYIFIAIFTIALSANQCYFSPKVIFEQLRSNFISDSRNFMYQRIGQAFDFFRKEIRNNESVVYDSSPFFIYPLWRMDFGNNVFFIKSHTLDDWYGSLVDRDIIYIFTTRNSHENKFLNEKVDKKFHKIYSDDTYEIFKRI